jgi:outer membrane protein assembly factor BamB
MRFSGRARFLNSTLVGLSLLGLLCATRQSDGQVALPTENRQAAQRLEAADRLADPDWTPDAAALIVGISAGIPEGNCLSAAGSSALQRSAQENWPSALEEYQRLIYESGDDLVPVRAASPWEAAFARSISVRRLCHQRIAAAPPSVRGRYRERVEFRSKLLFGRAIADQDARTLRRLVADYFCSRRGDRALDLLGDLAFEKGNFHEALQWWGQLATPASEVLGQQTRNSGPLLFPDPGVDLARVRAKQILALGFAGEHGRAAGEFQAFQRLHGDAKGNLAGRSGTYALILKQVLHDLNGTTVEVAQGDWLAFGGEFSRNSVAAACPHPRLWADGPAWRVRLGSGGKGQEFPSPPNAEQRRRPAQHPVIADDQVLVADAANVYAHDLRTGRSLFHYTLGPALKDLAQAGPLERPSTSLNAGFTLTVSDKRVFACLGWQALEPGGPSARRSGPACLVCLSRAPALGPKESRELWRVKAPSDPKEAAVFEGAPVIHEGRVIVAVSRVVGGRTKTAVACYAAASGTPLWQQEVCETQVEGDQAPRGNQLLTLAGNYVVYCSHTGAIVALDARSGKPSWALRYPRRSPARPLVEPLRRELRPCVFGDGRLYSAPEDSDRLLCLDPSSGDILWERDGVEVVHLLGVGSGRLIFTTPGGLRALDARTGSDQGGWLLPNDSRLASFGRGLLAGAWVFWPTQDPELPVRAVTQLGGLSESESALPTTRIRRNSLAATYFDPVQLRHLTSGNMAFANGCLVVATGDDLIGYVPPLPASVVEPVMPKRPAGAVGTGP